MYSSSCVVFNDRGHGAHFLSEHKCSAPLAHAHGSYLGPVEPVWGPTKMPTQRPALEVERETRPYYAQGFEGLRFAFAACTKCARTNRGPSGN